jgi:peroxiredoxin
MTSNKYGLKKGNTISLPATFIVGKDGTYKYAHGGFDEEETPKEWKAVLDKLTK